jgi:hypothetical protein
MASYPESPEQYDTGTMSEHITGFNNAHEGKSLNVLDVCLAADKDSSLSWDDQQEHLKARAKNLQADFSRIN